MAKIEPLHSGPMLPLAIMAIFAVMIPVFSIANNNAKVQQTSAAQRKNPGNTPTPIKFVQPSPKATNKPSMQYDY